jgi:hypothetical protein
MRRTFCLCVALTLLLAVPALAQEEKDTTDSAADAESESSELLPSPAAAAGDVITLSSGKQLSGVQVLRSSPTTVEIQVLEGLEPLKLPRNQVLSIVYDDIDPNRASRDKKDGADIKPTIMPGAPVDAKFLEKLKAPLSNEELTYEVDDYTRIFEKLSKKAEVKITFDKTVKQLPPKARKWKLTIPPNTSIESVLQGKLLTEFTSLKAKYEYDHIVIKHETTPATDSPT